MILNSMHHLTRTQQFTRSSLDQLFALASKLEKEPDNSLKGKILAALFFEPSTRTRLSFSSAMLRLGGSVITMESGQASSQAKGETLEDSIRVVSNYCDAIVMRHPEEGAADRAAKVSKIPIINAGDGTGQHPTQALLDLYTIQRELGRTDGINIAIVGNLKYYRAARSLSYLLGKFNDIHLTLVSAPELRIRDDIKAYLRKHKVTFEETDNMQAAMKTADVIYQTRMQKEWMSPEEFKKNAGTYIITRKLADSMKKGAIIIHPLPRIGEITDDVDTSPHAVYFKQVRYGLLVRMALLKTILTKWK